MEHPHSVRGVPGAAGAAQNQGPCLPRKSTPPVRKPDMETDEISQLDEVADQHASLTGLVWR